MDCFPIVVTQNNFILDGQHRYRAAWNLRVPLYRIVADMTIEESSRGNTNTKKISHDDIAYSGDKMGLESYSFLQNTVEKYPFLTPSRIARINGQKMDDYVNLKFSVDWPVFTELFAGMYNDIKLASKLHYVVKGKGEGFFKRGMPGYDSAIEFLAQCSMYDHDRMLRKLGMCAMSVEPVRDMAQALVLNYVYNYKANGKDRVDFSGTQKKQEIF